MKAFVIPSIFTAIDKFSSPVKNMGMNMESFASKAEVGLARAERGFRKLTPALGGVAKQFLSFASTAAVVGSVIAGISFSANAMVDYEKGLHSLQAITGVTGDAFIPFKAKITEVANATKKSSIEVSRAFEIIGSADSSLLESADKIGLVTKAAITLSKASGDTLESSAQSLVSVMSQFSLASTEADRVINVLAAGAAVGSATIDETSEAMKNFGSVAAGANISIEKSVALVQVLGKFQVKGAEAGTKLRGSILQLQKAGLGYASGQFDINDALAEANKKINKLHSAKEKDAAMTKLFGAENISTGKILLANIPLFDQFSKGVTGTSTAVQQAAINSDTLSVAIDEIKAAWVNMITGSDDANSALNTVKRTIQFLTNNLDIIVSVGSAILLFFSAWKVLLIATSVALSAYNIGLGITGALSGSASIAIGANTTALTAYNVTTWLATAATTAFTAILAVLTSPITLIILAIVAVIALVTAIILKWNEWGAALSLFLGPLGLVISLIQSFRRNWEMITEAFKKGGIIAGFKAIGATILDAILMPLQQVAKIIADLTGSEMAANAVKSIEAFRKGMGVNVTTDESGESLAKPAVNPEASKQSSLQETIKQVSQNVKLLIDNKTGYAASVESDNNFVPVSLSSTMGFK
jgi:TP901 family phage tail tape measure protein